MELKKCIVVKSDENYFYGLRNLLRSLQKTNPNLPIYLIDFGLKNEQLEELSCLVNQILSVTDALYKPTGTPDNMDPRLNETVFGLMYLKDVDADLVLFLDADIVVLDDLDCVFKTLDNNNSAITAPRDYPPLSFGDQIGKFENYNLLKMAYDKEIDLSGISFNAGILCIKKNILRKLQNDMSKLYNLGIPFPMNEQSMLNIVCALYPSIYKINLLDVHFNFRPIFRRAPSIKPNKYELHKGILVPYFNDERVKILHFIGPEKPWHKHDNNDPFYKVWAQFS